MTEPLLGQSINRLEDERFVRGRGRYIADLPAPNALHGIVVRSTHAHARIIAIRIDAARQMPGVAAVFTGLDLASDNIGPLPCAVTNIPMTTPLVVPPYHALARDIVRYVGEPVAFVVAESAESARDAAEAVVVDYEPLQPVVSIADAVLPGSPVDLAGSRRTTSHSNSIAARSRRSKPRSAVPPMSWNANWSTTAWWPRRWKHEVRSARSTPSNGRLHLIASAAGAHTIRDLLADTVFGIPREKLRVSIPDVGGGFGMKNVLYPEWVLVLWAARRLGRPVKWIGDRSEDFVASTHGRDSVVRARLALDRDGRLLALETTVLANLGAYVSTVAPVVPTMAMASAMGGVYDIPLIAFQASGVFTNTTPVDAYRGAGKPEANYLIERCIDIAATELGMDALELRRKNIFRRFPHRSAMGLSVEQGSFAHAIDHAVAAAAGFERAGKSRARGAGCVASAMPAFSKPRAASPMKWRKCLSARMAGSI